jgi:uncharacterized protein YrrD
MAIRSGGELTGLAVITLEGGERLGRLHDVIFRMPLGQIAGFLVSGGGLFAKTQFLPISQVRSVGTDAVTITGAEALSDKNPANVGSDEFEGRSQEGCPVLSTGGTVLGKIADVLVDTDALTVSAFLISTGLVTNALHGKPRLPLALVRTLGKDSVVVPDTYDPGAAEYHGPSAQA